MNDSFEVYSGGGYVLGIEDGLLYARIGGETYKLTCHPYEPCLYITDGGGRVTSLKKAAPEADAKLRAIYEAQQTEAASGRGE